MAQITYSIRVTLESIQVLDDQDWFAAGEIYLLASIDGHGTGRSPIFRANSGDTITLTGPQWSHEVMLRARTSIPISVEVWDEDLIFDDALGALMVNAVAPYAPARTSTRAPSGNFILNWSVAQTIVTADRAGVGLVSRQHDGSSYSSRLASPRVAVVGITEIRGLYQPGVDDRPLPIAPGTTKNSSYVAGYISADHQGRIFRNRALDGTWSKDHQQIELKVEITPAAVALPAGCKIRWTVQDPDDPSNEGPMVHAEAGKILDPNDYSGAVKTAAAAGDNDPSGVKVVSPYFAQADALYPLTSAETTVVDIPTRISKVLFNTSDVCGDNYRIRAELVDCAGFDLLVPDQSGIMTVWERVDLEYVKMASALELPVNEIAAHYDIARVQVDVTLKRVVVGASDTPAMTLSADDYASRASGEFTMEGRPGWFFIAAANRESPASSATVLYQGDAECLGNLVRLPAAAAVPFGLPPAIIRIFNPPGVAGLVGNWPNNRDIHFKFRIRSITGREIDLVPHDFHLPSSPIVPFLDAHLSHYGFAMNSTLKVQVLSHGDDALVTGGISPGGIDIGGNHFFGGRLIVFTRSLDPPEMIRVLCHELCHAFDNAHKCGNFDWRNQTPRMACCMNYWFQFLLDNRTPRIAIPWTQNRVTADLCAAHIRRMRDYHLEENPGLGW